MPLVVYGCGTWSHTETEDNTFSVREQVAKRNKICKLDCYHKVTWSHIKHYLWNSVHYTAFNYFFLVGTIRIFEVSVGFSDLKKRLNLFQSFTIIGWQWWDSCGWGRMVRSRRASRRGSGLHCNWHTRHQSKPIITIRTPEELPYLPHLQCMEIVLIH